MATITSAKKKWGAKMPLKGPAWKKGVETAIKGDHYSKGLKEFLEGREPNPEIVKMWKEMTGKVTAEDFASAVRGKEEKWARRYLSVMAAG
ncbi:hypothetical protein DRN32_06320 [Thermococci archaeon]|nr:MAG: hypothetical protein DRN32_06320 [Thermococci archaeon]